MDERLAVMVKAFRENKVWLADRITNGIEANRKGFAQLRFVDSEGNPLENVSVRVNQKTHDFRFGCNLFMLEELETPEKNEEFKRRYAEMFNLAILPFYWSDLEREQGKPRFSKDSPKVYRRPAPDLCLEYCREHGIEPKLHCLNYDQWTPIWVPVDSNSVKQLLDKRMKEIAERYRDQIPSMEVINETLCNEYLREHRHSTLFFRDPDIVEWSFAHARNYLPANRLIINEATPHVWGQFKYNRSAYYMQIQRALEKGATIDSIGFQYHLFYKTLDAITANQKVVDPEVMCALMDQYADFGKPMQVTEVTVPAFSTDPEDEQVQAELITTLYSLWFSHPNMEAIVYWNLIDGYAAFAPQGDMTAGENMYHGALLRHDMSPKPAYFALYDLIHKTWQSNVEQTVNGQTDIKGFYGVYDVTATVDGKTVTKQIHLKKGHKNQFTICI